MMNPLLYSLPLDLTGQARDNHILGEVHNLDHQEVLPFRCVVLNHGYFYTDDLLIQDNTGRELTLETDYQLTGFNKDAVMQSGKSVCSVIVLVNPRVGNTIYVNAHMVGGEYTHLAPTIAEMAKGLLNNTRSVQYHNLEDRPEKFAPNGHLHALWDLYGFETWTLQLQRIVGSLIEKSRQQYVTLQGDFDERMQALNERMVEEMARLARHIANKENPHRVNKEQVQLELVADFPPASEPDARTLGAGVKNRYTTPLRTAQHIEENFGKIFTNHVNARNNPHRLTYTQVGGMSKVKAEEELAGKLGVNDTARSTQRLQNYLYSAIYSNARANLDAAMVTIERFNQARLGDGVADRESILIGNATWVNIRSLFNTYEKKIGSVLYVQSRYNDPNTAVSNISVTYADNVRYPIGTIVLFKYLYTKYMGTGNGAYTTQITVFAATMKTASGWVY
jgi:hypothetical protein